MRPAMGLRASGKRKAKLRDVRFMIQVVTDDYKGDIREREGEECELVVIAVELVVVVIVVVENELVDE